MASNENGFTKNYTNIEIDLVDETLIRKQVLNLIKDLRPEWKEEAIDFKVSELNFARGNPNFHFRCSATESQTVSLK